jgi:hypothetical protein
MSYNTLFPNLTYASSFELEEKPVLLDGQKVLFEKVVALMPSDKTATSKAMQMAQSATPNWAVVKQQLVTLAIAEWTFWHTPHLITETQVAARQKLKDYWNVVGIHPSDADLGSNTWQNDHPWSAVFISWVVRQAGANGFFRYAAAHSHYIVAARQNRATNDTSNPFWAYPITAAESAWAEVGDIICKNRDGNNYTLDSLAAGHISHCDIIVEVDRTQNALITIGGNVVNSVRKRRIFLTAQGFVDTSRQWEIFEGATVVERGSQQVYFALIKVRTNTGVPTAPQTPQPTVSAPMPMPSATKQHDSSPPPKRVTK